MEERAMLKLHGFSASNYYNLVKLTLLEKDLPFEEVLVYTGAGPGYRPDFLQVSPLGKVPCLETEHGFLTESRCILDYLESSQGGTPLYPSEPFARAKVLELMQVIELYLELAARRILPNYFAQKPPSERVGGEILQALAKGAHALSALASFDGYLFGDRLSAADLAAAVHLPVVRHVVKKVLGKDPLASLHGLDDYLARLEARPALQRVRADAAVDFPRFMKHVQGLQGAAS